MVINKINIKHYMTAILLLLSSAIICMPVLAATITAAVDRNPVKLDESFQLVLTIEGGVDGEPALDVLKKDFDILGRSQSSNFQLINGHMSRQTQFIITLMPKTEGRLNIPPISVGSDSSQEIILTVLKQSASAQTNTDVSLDVNVDKKKAYIQEQLIVTVRLYRSVSLANASLSAPQVSGAEAVIEKLGDDSEFDMQRNGVNLRVVERRYAIFPQQSGVMAIDPVQFNGQIVQASSRFSNNPLLQNTRNKRLRSEPIKINISAIPASQADKPWLPAHHIMMTEQWQESPPVFKVGEAITRTLTITADGLMAAQLPEIGISMPTGIKHYSDQAVMNDQYQGTGIIGSRQQKIAIIPSKEGSYTLPEIKLEWWNTKTQRSETLQIPKRRIKVMAADVSSPSSGPESPVADVGDKTIRQVDGAGTLMFEATPLAVLARAGFWPWLCLVLLLGWLVTFLIMRSQKQALLNRRDQELQQSPEITLSKKTAIKNLKQACFNNDPVETKEALLVWARLRFGNHVIASMADIANYSNDVIGDEVGLLNQVLYSENNDGAWSGQGLWQAIDLYNKSSGASKGSNKRRHALAPLYP